MLGFAVGQFVDQLVDPQSGIRKRARTIVDNSLDQRLIAAFNLAKDPPDYAFQTLSGPERATGAIPPTIQSDLAEVAALAATALRSEEHTSELQSLMRTSYAVFCLKKKK